MSLLAIVLALALALCKSSAGFLYSPVTNSFICKSNELSKAGSIPLKFVIDVPDTHNKGHNRKFVMNFDVLNISGKPGNGNKISINRRGEVKLYKGDRCETAYDMYLRSETCKKTFRQIFIWVPEQHFSEFVSATTNRAGKSDKEEQPKDPYSELKGSISDIKDMIKSKGRSAKALPDICKDSLRRMCRKGGKKNGRFTDKMMDAYLWAYCASRLSSNKCSSPMARENDRKGKKMCLQENMCVGQEGTADDSKVLHGPSGIVDQILSILKSQGVEARPHQAYQSSKVRPRARGFLGRGEDSWDVGTSRCRCKFECVRNPKNGMCFYTYTADGKLKPMMKNESCCEEGKAKLCDHDNIVEKYLCELTVKNDYSHVSKFLDDNFACN